MRADRLVSLVLLLRQQGRMTADALAAELEVSSRTVLRDIEALSSAGVPVYADRGRHGGFSLLPGFRTELTGLNPQEALALLASGQADGSRLFGLNADLASATRKVMDALPPEHRERLRATASRFLVEPEFDLLSRARVREEIPREVMAPLRRAVASGLRVRVNYEPEGRPAGWRVLDPLGLVTARGRTYLLALREGQDRTYRLSRVLAVEVLDEPARRPEKVDLRELWAARAAQFLADGRLSVRARVRAERAAELLASARAVHRIGGEREGWSELEVAFDDERHAVWAIWRLEDDAEVLAPASLRAALRERARGIASLYEG